MTEQMSWVKALQDYFSKEPLARKIEMAEFKELTHADKVELRDLLIGEGYDVAPVKEAA